MFAISFAHIETPPQEAIEIDQLDDICQPIDEQREFYWKMKVQSTLIHITDNIWLFWSTSISFYFIIISIKFHRPTMMLYYTASWRSY